MQWETYFNILLDKYGLLSRLKDLEALGSEILRWNKTHNLTAYNNWPVIAMGLMADSLILAEFCKQGSCLDIGSGAGFPGLMLALARPDIKVTLIDARRKRVSFQQHAARMLNLGNVSCVWGRAGEGRDALIGEKYDTVTCKALSSLPLALQLCQKYAKSDAKIVLPRGSGDLREIAALVNAMSVHHELHEYELPLLPGKRFVLVLAAR